MPALLDGINTRVLEIIRSLFPLDPPTSKFYDDLLIFFRHNFPTWPTKSLARQIQAKATQQDINTID